MEHLVTAPPVPFGSADGRLAVHCVPVWRDNLAWIAVCTATGAAAVIDAPEPGPVLAYAQAHGLDLRTLFNTHVHGDHIGINRALARAGALAGWRVEGPAGRAAEVPGLTRGLGEGDTVTLGALTGQVWLTEGHQDGHLSFVFGDVLFCGDTLFAGGCGYLFDGPPAKMLASLERFAALPDDTRVCCAHEYTEDNLAFAAFMEPDNPALAARVEAVRRVRAAGGCTVPSTIGTERATNPFLRAHLPSLRARVAALDPTADRSDALAVFTAVRRLKDRKVHRAG